MYFRRQVARISNYLDPVDQFLSFFIQKLDSLRVKLLLFTLKSPILKTIYTQCALRLGTTFLLLCFLSLALSSLRPDLLLFFGPLIYGYMHLVASYRFTQPLIKSQSVNKVQRGFMLFCFITLIEIIVQGYIKAFYPQLLLPNGYLGIIATIILVLYLAFFSSAHFNIISLFFVAVANILLLKYAWSEPLNFVSVALFLHNWVAFAFWIYFAKDRSNLVTALSATILFAVIHALVIFGFLDSYLVREVENVFFTANVRGTAWILAPWSGDPIVWKRALCLYTFGLSLHYFIWLRALPENIQKNSCPTSFKMTFTRLKKELGNSMVCFLFLLSLVGTLLWMLFPTLGTTLYFSLSNIHVWLELTFLLSLFKFPKLRQS